MHLKHSFVAVAALLAASVAAHADTITQTYSEEFSYASAYPPIGSAVTLAGFNPALGTLNSISGTFSGTEASSHGIALNLNTPSGASFVGYESQLPQDEAPSAGPVSAGGSITDPYSVLSAVSTGPVDFAFFVNGFDGGSVSGTLVGTVTYDYTPNAVAATPEPSSIALLGTGLLGVAGVVRKRLA